jgi:hypothetical protein
MGKDLRGNGRGLIGVLFQYLSGGTKESRERPQPGKQLSRPRYEPNSCWIIQFDIVTFRPAFRLLQYRSRECKIVTITSVGIFTFIEGNSN